MNYIILVILTIYNVRYEIMRSFNICISLNKGFYTLLIDFFGSEPLPNLFSDVHLTQYNL